MTSEASTSRVRYVAPTAMIIMFNSIITITINYYYNNTGELIT